MCTGVCFMFSYLCDLGHGASEVGITCVHACGVCTQPWPHVSASAAAPRSCPRHTPTDTDTGPGHQRRDGRFPRVTNCLRDPANLSPPDNQADLSRSPGFWESEHKLFFSPRRDSGAVHLLRTALSSPRGWVMRTQVAEEDSRAALPAGRGPAEPPLSLFLSRVLLVPGAGPAWNAFHSG